MAGLGCFVKDTSVVKDMSDVMQILAGVAISNDQRFTVEDAYRYFKKNKVEVDAESVASVYENTFPLHDGNFSSVEEVDEFSVRAFSNTLDNFIAIGQVSEDEKQIGALSPGKAAAKHIVDVFAQAHNLSEQPKSTMLTFQKMMQRAAMAMANKKALPQKPSGKDTRTFIEILTDALDFQDSNGFRTVSGTINNANDMIAEFKAEVNKYISEMRAKNADEAAIAQFEMYSEQVINATYSVLLSQKEMKNVIIGALIDRGFGKTKKDGTKVIDWDALSNGTGIPNFIRQNVTEVLSQNGFTDEQIDRINKSLVKEYNDITAYVIERAQIKIEEQNAREATAAKNELDRRNKVVKTQQSIDAKRMARLYNLGFFNLLPNAYENILNKMVGMAEVDQKTFDELKQYGQLLSVLYAQKTVNASGVEFDAPETFYRDAINAINEKIGSILRQYQNNKSKMMLIARVFDNYIGATMRMVLVGAVNMVVQNPLSGWMQSKFADLYLMLTSNVDTPELRKIRKEVGKAIFNDMISNRGEHYGPVSSTFYARGALDHLKNRIDDWVTKGKGSELLQRWLSFLTGKMLLDATDSRFKANITQKFLIHNVFRILTSPNNPNRMSKEGAQTFIAESLSMQKIEQAAKQAEALIKRVNDAAGKQVLSDKNPFIVRLANDIVKANLIAKPAGDATPPISLEQLEAAFDSAYGVAGREMGHVANNIASAQIGNVSASITTATDKAIKQKQYPLAAMYTIGGSLYRNLLNAFAGGAMNWVVIKTEKLGLGVITGGAKMAMMKASGATVKDVDLSDPKDVKELSDAMYRETVQQMKLIKGFVGGVSNILLLLAAKSIIYSYFGADDDDEKDEAIKKYNEWRKKNYLAGRVVDQFTSEWFLAYMAYQNEDLLNYSVRALSLDNPNAPTQKTVDAIRLFTKGKKAEAEGKIGEAVGSVVGVPVPWRFFRDLVELAKWTAGKDTPNEYVKSRDFIQGALKNGLLYDLGVRYEPEYTLDSLEGVSSNTKKKLAVADEKVTKQFITAVRTATENKLKKLKSLSEYKNAETAQQRKLETMATRLAVGDVEDDFRRKYRSIFTETLQEQKERKDKERELDKIRQKLK